MSHDTPRCVDFYKSIKNAREVSAELTSASAESYSSSVKRPRSPGSGLSQKYYYSRFS